MDIIKTTLDWTRAELLSSMIFVFFGLLVLMISFGFWQLGKTEMAKAFVIPCLIAGGLVLAIGLGIGVQSYGRLSSFPMAFDTNPTAFVTSELNRAETVLAQYRLFVYRIFPIAIAICAILFLFLDGPLWRASLITAMATLAVVMGIDTNANARLAAYQSKLQTASQ